jgi:putative transposase
MSKLRRYYSEGNVYFITAVTYQRIPVLVENIDLFWQTIDELRQEYDFKIVAWVILPDHFHMIINPFHNNLSDLMKIIKLIFSAKYRSLLKINKGRIRQYRFWDHVIRNNDDMNRHLDYIHYNPVKHHFVSNPFEYPHS